MLAEAQTISAEIVQNACGNLQGNYVLHGGQVTLYDTGIAGK